jgi:hypothetical protein
MIRKCLPQYSVDSTVRKIIALCYNTIYYNIVSLVITHMSALNLK